MNRTRRWLVPVAVAAAVAGGVAVSGLQAGADLAPKTPAQVLVLAQQPTTSTFSGTVEVQADLGLPELSGLLGGGQQGSAGASGAAVDGVVSDLTALLAGDSELRVWSDGPQRLRVQLMSGMSESDLVRNGTTAWVYRSADRSAVRLALPAAATEGTTQGSDQPPSVGLTPQQLADRLLAAVDRDTTVTAGDPVRVAGRDAYQLVLQPTAPQSTVGRVAVAVDATTGLVLRVRVDARGSTDPALLVGFTDFSTATPPAARFAFTPPAGTTVREQAVPKPGPSDRYQDGAKAKGDVAEPRAIGSGWTTVVEVPAGVGARALPPQAAALLRPTEGGSLLSTRLVNVLVTPDGRWYVGAVTPEALRAAAGR